MSGEIISNQVSGIGGVVVKFGVLISRFKFRGFGFFIPGV